MTLDAFRNRTKTVTRRLGWWNLKAGDVLMGVEKAQGIPKGGKIVMIWPIRVVSVRREVLGSIHAEAGATASEGFPGMSVGEFMCMFSRAHGCDPATEVNRIEFEHLFPCYACEELLAEEEGATIYGEGASFKVCDACWPRFLVPA